MHTLKRMYATVKIVSLESIDILTVSHKYCLQIIESDVDVLYDQFE